jgi:hypothetical protein
MMGEIPTITNLMAGETKACPGTRLMGQGCPDKLPVRVIPVLLVATTGVSRGHRIIDCSFGCVVWAGATCAAVSPVIPDPAGLARYSSYPSLATYSHIGTETGRRPKTRMRPVVSGRGGF